MPETEFGETRNTFHISYFAPRILLFHIPDMSILHINNQQMLQIVTIKFLQSHYYHNLNLNKIYVYILYAL